jgi:hypothetical protein
MAQNEGSVFGQNLRIAIGVAVGLSVMALTSESVVDVVPIAVLAFGMLSYSFLDDRYGLPDGSERAIYGFAVSFAGTAFVILYPFTWVSMALSAVGGWFVLDGASAVLYGDEVKGHEYVSEGEDSEEVMSRMMSLRKVYVAVKDASEPQTPEELAEEHGFEEKRTESALEYLDSRGRVSKQGDRYRAEPQRWGKLTPLFGFLTWLPSRLLRPFYRIATGGC